MSARVTNGTLCSYKRCPLTKNELLYLAQFSSMTVSIANQLPGSLRAFVLGSVSNEVAAMLHVAGIQVKEQTPILGNLTTFTHMSSIGC